jgi:ATP-dependent Lon protease
MADRPMLPVLPLRDTVLYPGVSTPLTVGRPKTLRAVEAALRDTESGGELFAVAQRDTIEDPTIESLYPVGIIGRIAQVQRFGSTLQLVLYCEARAAAIRYAEADGVIRAAVARLDDVLPSLGEEAALMVLAREVREQAIEYGRRRGAPEEVLRQFIGTLEDPANLANHVAFYLDLSTVDKQEILETLAPESRLRALSMHLTRQMGLAETQERIRGVVQDEIEGRQRELYLREQLRAIQKELGEDEESGGVSRLEQRIDAANLPPEVLTEVRRDLSRLKRMNRETSPEAQVLTGWLECVGDLPWSARTEDHVDVHEAQRILDADHFGLGDVKDRIIEFLAVRKLRADRATTNEERTRATARGPILLFVGPPGTGKTSIAESIARAIGRKYIRVSLGGARDEADIRGHRRTYVGAMPGRILQGMKRAGTKNPVFALDEVDKLCASYQGDPSAALLEALDPAQNSSFVDHYLGVPFDLSEVLFVCTANSREPIPAPLLDRMEVITFAGYTDNEKIEIARRYLVDRKARESGLAGDELELDDDAMREIITGYTREAGVRQLEREIGSIARKVARQLASGGVLPSVARAEQVRELLGRPRVHAERRLSHDSIGVATGMYYTPAGGDIMMVEASVMPGAGELVLTGQLGDVMKESGRAALTYAKTHAAELGVPEEHLRERAFHVHVPAGAIQKDGPSAGVAMAAALVSALLRRPVRSTVAMTGEITLRGRILPVGGLKEKILGAYRAGVTEIILPRDNAGDLEDLPDEVRRSVAFHLVVDLDRAIALAITPAAVAASPLHRAA